MYAMPVILAPESRPKIPSINYYTPAEVEAFSTDWLPNRREKFHEAWKHFREPIDYHSIKKAIANHKHHPVTTDRLCKRSVRPVGDEEQEVVPYWRNTLDVPLDLAGPSGNLETMMARTVDKVRRSSDAGIFSKSKRLIHHPRHPSSSYRNNLDRNERSTLSHLSGPSRKIQLFIKNRFVQLMPDGTVNGTQDDMSEYSEYDPYIH